MNNLLMNKKVINIIDDSQNQKYTLHEGQTLVINYFNHNPQSFNIDITQESNTYLVINISVFTYENIQININSYIKGNNNRCVINTRAIAYRNHADINVCVHAQENTQDNEIVEDLKGIIEGGTINLMPILEIDTCEVDAAHYATVGSFNEEELFYLQTKGISYDECLNILKNNFIYNLFSEEFVRLVDERKEKYE